MSRGFNTRKVPTLVVEGIESAFRQWKDMSGGDWLHTAPEYLVTVQVAQKLRKEIPPSQRTIWMEPGVARILDSAGGIQRGRKPELLRVDGRFDIVLAHADERPRTVIEIKNPLWQPNGRGPRADLHRLCRALLHGKAGTQIYNGALGIFTSAAVPRKGADSTARERLARKWLTDWRKTLRSWEWADKHAERYRESLRIDVTGRIHEVEVDTERHAWAAVCVEVWRSSPRGTS